MDVVPVELIRNRDITVYVLCHKYMNVHIYDTCLVADNEEFWKCEVKMVEKEKENQRFKDVGEAKIDR